MSDLFKRWFGCGLDTRAHNPFLIGAAFNAVAGALGRRDEMNQARNNTREANQAANRQNNKAWKRNKEAAALQTRRNREDATVAERRSDVNAATSRRFNDRQARKAERFSAREADKANRFTKGQNDLAYQRSEKRDLRNRDWAKEDYDQQKDDFATQYTRGRAAAEAAGLNPLSVLGGQMTPMSGAGGLSSSSYGAGQGVGGSGVSASSGFTGAVPAAAASVPMSYGAPVDVQPLVSNAAVLGAVHELGQELTGANAIQRQTDTLQRDLAQIQLDQLRSGVTGPQVVEGGSYPEISASRVPTLDTRQAMPAESFSMSDFAAGFAPTFHGPSSVSTLGAETTPDTIGSGMAMISNNFLPGSDQEPYAVAGDVEEAFQLENLPINIPLIGAQMIGRIQRLQRADQAYRDAQPLRVPGSGSPVSFTVPSLGMTNRQMTMLEAVDSDRRADRRREDEFFRYQESQITHREGR